MREVSIPGDECAIFEVFSEQYQRVDTINYKEGNVQSKKRQAIRR